MLDVRTLATVANLLSVARRLTRAQAGTVYRRQTDGLQFLVTQNDELAGSLGHEASADLLARAPLPWTERSIAAYVALARRALNISDAYHIATSEPYAFNPRFDVMTGFRTISMLVVPLESPLAGVLQLINATDEGGHVIPFSRDAEIAVTELASDCATAGSVM